MASAAAIITPTSKAGAIVMHPGPMNRGVEIDPGIADGERSVILDQVEAGVAVRMAVLWRLAAEAHEGPPGYGEGTACWTGSVQLF